MQDQYFGDVNDYRKYGLLRCLGDAGFRVGVCWMFTPRDNSGQGKRIRYLDKPNEHGLRDPELFNFLRERVRSHRRTIREIETAPDTPLNGVTFFSDLLPEGAVERDVYMSRALIVLRKMDLLFFDPNIGLETPSVRYGRAGSSNYLYWWEVERAAHEQATLVIFQHWTQNEKRRKHLSRLSSALRCRVPTTSVYAFKSPHILFLVACQPRHRVRFEKAVMLAQERWSGDMDIVRPRELGGSS